jgi:hypothetical protein
MRKKFLLVGLVILLMGVGLAVGSSRQKAPLVSEISIDPPDPALPEEVKALSGTWAGEWNSRWGWDCIIYVERVDKDFAQLVHSWGEYNTSRGSCHCAPDWRRVERARVNYSGGKATIEYTTPLFSHLQGLNPSHALSGSFEGPVQGRKGSSGRYTFSFTVEKSTPDMMKGHFISSQAGQLRIELKKIDSTSLRN